MLQIGKSRLRPLMAWEGAALNFLWITSPQLGEVLKDMVSLCRSGVERNDGGGGPKVN